MTRWKFDNEILSEKRKATTCGYYEAQKKRTTLIITEKKKPREKNTNCWAWTEEKNEAQRLLALILDDDAGKSFNYKKLLTKWWI